MGFKFISSFPVGVSILRAVSFTLYRMSARSWHIDRNFPTAVLYSARLSFFQLNQGICRWRSLDTRSGDRSRIFQFQQGNHVAFLLRIRLNRLVFSWLFCKGRKLIDQLRESFRIAHRDLCGHMYNQPFTSRSAFLKTTRIIRSGLNYRRSMRVATCWCHNVGVF